MRLARLLGLALPLFTASMAQAQVTFDSPLARRPAPNVMVIISSDRTNGIAANCGDGCHGGGGGGWGSGSPDDIWIRGETRLQFVRRALTGGYGLDTPVLRPDGKPADAIVRTDGVMDTYKVRWGVAWYDGLGTRLAIDPTSDNEAAQRAVIDYGQPANDFFTYNPPAWYAPAYPTLPNLNSFELFPFTVWDGNYYSPTWDPWVAANAIPWNNRRIAHAPGRISSALQWATDYFDPGKNAVSFTASDGAELYPMWFAPGTEPNDEQVINGDPANVLVSPGAAGCRRNFVVLLSDGGGPGVWNGKDPGQAAADIYHLGSGTTVDPGEETQTFSIHFGNWAPVDSVADYGWDGVAGGLGPTTAFQAIVGGKMDLAPIRSAFGAIFSLVLAGEYAGAAPTLSRAGTSLCGGHRCDRAVISDFNIFDCAGISPERCNSGRPSSLKWVRLDPSTGAFVGGYPATCTWPDCYDMGELLRSREWSDRWTLTAFWDKHGHHPKEDNCGDAATCKKKEAELISLGLHPATTIPGLKIVDNTPWPKDLEKSIQFVRGDPTATFLDFPGALQRGDTDNDLINNPMNPYKLADVANSRPVIVGAPPGVGEFEPAWSHFLAQDTPRGFGVGTPKVRNRDQVVYVGANDGFLHAFLVGKASSTTLGGSSVTYESTGALCPNITGPIAPGAGVSHSSLLCDGREIWAYSPNLVQGSWDSMRSAHTYMVDATPIVDDVVFTDNKVNPSDWEYRTVLMQCLGGGGPGCFALDVTNPWSPRLLWERTFDKTVPGKGASTSQPVIAKVKRKVGSKVTPYYVALMGGGQNESGKNGRKGTFIAVGLEDGRVFRSAACDPLTEPGCSDFAAGPTCLDADNDGYTETCYIPTTSGSIYKARLISGNPDPGQGGGIEIGELFRGCHSTAAATCDLSKPHNDPARIKAFSRITLTADANNRTVLLYATGDIEDAADPDETNYVFKLRDPNPAGPLVAWTGARNTALQADACTSVPSGLTKVNEGSFQLPAGEKVLFSPVLVAGSILFTSYRPSSNPCLAGEGFLYGLRYDTCENGLDTNHDGTSDKTRLSLGSQLPGEVAVNYGRGDIFIGNTSPSGGGGGGVGPITANPARTPPPSQFRLQKLNWRRM